MHLTSSIAHKQVRFAGLDEKRVDLQSKLGPERRKGAKQRRRRNKEQRKQLEKVRKMEGERNRLRSALRSARLRAFLQDAFDENSRDLCGMGMCVEFIQAAALLDPGIHAPQDAYDDAGKVQILQDLFDSFNEWASNNTMSSVLTAWLDLAVDSPGIAYVPSISIDDIDKFERNLQQVVRLLDQTEIHNARTHIAGNNLQGFSNVISRVGFRVNQSHQPFINIVVHECTDGIVRWDPGLLSDIFNRALDAWGEENSIDGDSLTYSDDSSGSGQSGGTSKTGSSGESTSSGLVGTALVDS